MVIFDTLSQTNVCIYIYTMNTLDLPMLENQQVQPVSVGLAIVMIIITTLYNFGQLQTLPCGPNLISSLFRNFIHVDWFHIILNMYAFFRLMVLEQTFGSSFYFVLILLLTIFQTLIEWIIYSNYEINCSIGFSGILFGLYTWMILTLSGQDWSMLLALILSIISSSARDPRLSLLGHLLGVVSGLLVWLLSKPFLHAINPMIN